MRTPARCPWPHLVAATLALGLGGCRAYAYLLGYPQTPKPTHYRYYDPHFAVHNAAALARSKLKLIGFYYRPGGTRPVTGPLTDLPPPAVYLKFAADSSFVLQFAYDAPNAGAELVLRANPSGYYRLAGDTVWLQAQAAKPTLLGTPRLVVGYACLRPDSVQVCLPELVAPAAHWFRHYH